MRVAGRGTFTTWAYTEKGRTQGTQRAEMRLITYLGYRVEGTGGVYVEGDKEPEGKTLIAHTPNL
jgi:hypothetical protein